MTLATSVAAMWVALRKAPPESNEQLALKVSRIQIEQEDIFDALEKWGKRQSVRDSRARSKDESTPTEPASPTKTGILRQPLNGGRLIGGRNPTGG